MSTEKSKRQLHREQLYDDLAAGRITPERHASQLARMSSHHDKPNSGMGAGAKLRQSLRLLIKLLGRHEITLDDALARLDASLKKNHEPPPEDHQKEAV